MTANVSPKRPDVQWVIAFAFLTPVLGFVASIGLWAVWNSWIDASTDLDTKGCLTFVGVMLVALPAWGFGRAVQDMRGVVRTPTRHLLPKVRAWLGLALGVIVAVFFSCMAWNGSLEGAHIASAFGLAFAVCGIALSRFCLRYLLATDDAVDRMLVEDGERWARYDRIWMAGGVGVLRLIGCLLFLGVPVLIIAMGHYEALIVFLLVTGVFASRRSF